MAIRQSDIMKPLGRPRRVVSKPRHSVSVLIRRSWPSRRQSAKRIAVRSIKVVKLPKNEMFKGQAVAYRILTHSKDNKHTHRVTVFVDTGWFSSKSKVVVDCSCSDFVYTFEYVLAYTGNAMIWRCNGDTPDERNPGHRIGLCLAGHTRVLTDEGYKAIKDLNKGDYAVSLTGKSHLIEQLVDTGVKESLVVRTDKGSPITTSKKHRFLVYRDSNLKWTTASNLVVGDKLVSPRTNISRKERVKSHSSIVHYSPSTRRSAESLGHRLPVRFGYRLSYLLGMFCGDVHLDTKHRKIAFCQKDFYTVDRIGKALKSVFGIDYSIVSHPLVYYLRLSADDARFIYSFLADMGVTSRGLYQSALKFPKSLLAAGANAKKGFVSGYWEADGHSAKDVSCYSNSREFLSDFQALLYSMGIYTSLGVQGRSDWGNIDGFTLRLTDALSKRALINMLHGEKGKYAGHSVGATYDSGVTNLDLFDFSGVTKRYNEATTSMALVEIKKNIEGMEFVSDLSREWKKVSGSPVFDDFVSYLNKSGDGFKKQRLYTHKDGEDRLGKASWCSSHDTFIDYLKTRYTLGLPRERVVISRNNYMEYYWFLTKREKRVLRILEDARQYRLTPVTSITAGPRVRMYDIAVDKSHHFIAEGVVVHNCKHLIAALTVMHRRSLAKKLVRSTRSNVKLNWSRGK